VAEIALDASQIGVYVALMPNNPYEPADIRNGAATMPRVQLAHVGFFLSLIGSVGVFLVGPFGLIVSLVGACAALLCFPGLLVSLLALRNTPRRMAVWGVGLGVFGSLFLPTLLKWMLDVWKSMA
jgi:hypothetical protein